MSFWNNTAGIQSRSFPEQSFSLLWEGDGFLLLYKHLEDGKYEWPRNESEVRSITHAQLRWLTEGLSIDQTKAVRKIQPINAF